MFKQFLLIPTVLTLFLLIIATAASIKFQQLSFETRQKDRAATLEEQMAQLDAEQKEVLTLSDESKVQFEKAQAARSEAERALANLTAQHDQAREKANAADSAFSDSSSASVAERDALGRVAQQTKSDLYDLQKAVEKAAEDVRMRRDEEQGQAQNLEHLIKTSAAQAREISERKRKMMTEERVSEEYARTRVKTDGLVSILIAALLAVPVWFFLAIANAVLVLLIRRAQFPQPAANNNA